MTERTPSTADGSNGLRSDGSNGLRSDGSNGSADTGFLMRYGEEELAGLMILGGAFLFVYFTDPITKFAGVGLVVLALVTLLADWRFS